MEIVLKNITLNLFISILIIGNVRTVPAGGLWCEMVAMVKVVPCFAAIVVSCVFLHGIGVLNIYMGIIHF